MQRSKKAPTKLNLGIFIGHIPSDCIASMAVKGLIIVTVRESQWGGCLQSAQSPFNMYDCDVWLWWRVNEVAVCSVHSSPLTCMIVMESDCDGEWRGCLQCAQFHFNICDCDREWSSHQQCAQFCFNMYDHDRVTEAAVSIVHSSSLTFMTLRGRVKRPSAVCTVSL